ncbi:MAG: hypothetical protein ACLUD0_10330 [Eubacterium ramulus]
MIFGILIGTIVPVLMSTTIYNMVSIVDQWLFKNIATIQGYSAADVSEWWGIFSGKYRVLTNVPFPFPRHWQRPVFRHWQQLCTER